MVYYDLDAELATMQVTALALGRLDPSARTRVLHWLRERFDGATEPAAAIAAAVAPAPPVLRVVPPPAGAADEFLSVDTLRELFTPLPAHAPAASAAPIAVMLHEFVAEFQDLAREWDGASDAPADGRRRMPLSAAS
jgi:hypothetical protein